jgi:polar amino acid transport system permease protein
MIRDFGLLEILTILQGMWTTLALSAVAFVGGGVFGTLVALARTSAWKWLRVGTTAYIDFFQGTPMLMQLFLVYYGLPVFGFHVSAWTAVAIGLTFHASAFLGEIWRGGIQAVPKGQSEAASALGLGYIDRMRDVILPQAIKLSFAPTVGFLVQLIKGTSLAAIIGFVELSRSAQIVASTTYKPLIAYGLAGAFYFAICFPLSRAGAYYERRFVLKT